MTRLLFVFHAAGAVHGDARIFTPDPYDFAVFKAFTCVAHSLETGEMPVRTIDRPSWLAPSPTSVCVSAVDQALPQIETAAPNPSIVWYLVAVFTVMSGVAVVRWGGRGRGGRGGRGEWWSGSWWAVVGAVPPVQATPFTAKLVGAGLLPVHEPLKPNETVPLVAIAPL